jgi:hypothetical protein
MTIKKQKIAEEHTRIIPALNVSVISERKKFILRRRWEIQMLVD